MQEPTPSYILRRAEPEHEPFMFRLYASQQTVAAACALDEAQREQLARMQFRARNLAYAASFPDAVCKLVCSPGGHPFGRLLAAELGHALHVIDISLLPEQRNKGVGGQILRDLQRGCIQSEKRITLQVPCVSPACRLYERLGFRCTSAGEVYAYMEWRPHVLRDELRDRPSEAG